MESVSIFYSDVPVPQMLYTEHKHRDSDNPDGVYRHVIHTCIFKSKLLIKSYYKMGK